MTGTVDLGLELPILASNIDLEGPGADQLTVRRNTGGDYRIFTVGSGSVVSISGITIANGKVGNSQLGGGIFNGGDLTITGSTISGNSSDFIGGGIRNAGTLTINDSTISGNNAVASGGGIYSDGGDLTITSSTISGNSAGSSGGGVRSDTNLSGITATITNSTISGNTATVFGGGVHNNDGLTFIEHSTITDNTAPSGKGSGVSSSGDNVTRTEVLSTIISANTNTDVDLAPVGTNSFDSDRYNLIGDGNATPAFDQLGDQSGVSDPGLADLAENGGPTQTHALLEDSPAIDAANNGSVPDTDQRGVNRPQDGDTDGEAVNDIGAFELEELDTKAPKVISTSPARGGEVGPAANIKATFSEEMRPTSVGNAFKLFEKGSTTQIAAQVSYDAATDKATLDPTNNLGRGLTYKAVVRTLAKDVAGNRLDQNLDPSNGNQPKVWTFTVRN